MIVDAIIARRSDAMRDVRPSAISGSWYPTTGARLSEAVDAHLAASVLDSGPRFDAVSALEQDGIGLEISVLTPGHEIRSVANIEIGCHELIVERGPRRGILFPQVATEHGWNAMTFASHPCLKAALPCRRVVRGARMLVFEAQVFGEDG